MSKKILSALLAALCLLIAMTAVPAVSPRTSVPAAAPAPATTSAPAAASTQTLAPGKYVESGKPGNPGQPALPGIIGMHISDALSITAEAAEPRYTEFEDLNGKSIGMITGAAFEELVRSKIPGVKEILFFSSAPDMLAALKAGKVEAYLMNNAVGTLLVNMDSSVAIFPKSLGDTTYGIAFKKTAKTAPPGRRPMIRFPGRRLKRSGKNGPARTNRSRPCPNRTGPAATGPCRSPAVTPCRP